MINKTLLIIVLSIFVFLSCTTNNNQNATVEHQYEVNLWHTKRIDGLKKDTGWLNLVGLHWIKEGENTIGSASSNNIQFPSKAPSKIGTITLIDSIITFSADNKSGVRLNGEIVTELQMNPDVSGKTTVLELDTFRWFIIKRGNKYGIRLRDLEADLLKSFDGIDRFPIDSLWRIKANFKKYDSPQKIMIPTILGTVEESFSPGKIEFVYDKQTYTLEPTSAGKGLFVVFADLTSGEETYGAGRFLYIEAPDSNNNIILDFNKAYNPPCAFTKYATCPLPPDGNKLRIRITAGEKNYGEEH